MATRGEKDAKARQQKKLEFLGTLRKYFDKQIPNNTISTNEITPQPPKSAIYQWKSPTLSYAFPLYKVGNSKAGKIKTWKEFNEKEKQELLDALENGDLVIELKKEEKELEERMRERICKELEEVIEKEVEKRVAKKLQDFLAKQQKKTRLKKPAVYICKDVFGAGNALVLPVPGKGHCGYEAMTLLLNDFCDDIVEMWELREKIGHHIEHNFSIVGKKKGSYMDTRLAAAGVLDGSYVTKWSEKEQFVKQFTGPAIQLYEVEEFFWYSFTSSQFILNGLQDMILITVSEKIKKNGDIVMDIALDVAWRMCKQEMLDAVVNDKVPIGGLYYYQAIAGYKEDGKPIRLNAWHYDAIRFPWKEKSFRRRLLRLLEDGTVKSPFPRVVLEYFDVSSMDYPLGYEFSQED